MQTPWLLRWEPFLQVKQRCCNGLASISQCTRQSNNYGNHINTLTSSYKDEKNESKQQQDNNNYCGEMVNDALQQKEGSVMSSLSVQRVCLQNHD
jgi:hypothetical protein